MDELATGWVLLRTTARLAASQATAIWRRRSGGEGSEGPDAGLGTLEMVILVLGLVTVAGLLVAALTAAVTSRTSQIR